jgi:hypothetical protein
MNSSKKAGRSRYAAEQIHDWDDDYAYEIKPLPKKGPDQGQNASPEVWLRSSKQ